MKAYSYNSVTKEFVSEIECLIDPLETVKLKKDTYLLPAGATFKAPLTAKNGKIAVFENNKWTIKDDLRGNVYYDKTTKDKKIISSIGEKPETNWTELKPLAFDDTCKWDKTKWVIDNAKVIELENIAQKETFIQDKIRKQAIDSLKADGVLDSNGDLV